MRAKVLAGSLAVALQSVPALAQSGVERFERQMEQLRRQDYRRDDSVAPVDQRLLVDYGTYLSAGYFSIDDRLGENHVLRQYEVLGYARLNLDGAHELFLRGRAGYRDFNDQDSFDGRGDEPIDPDLDRGYYRFDLRQFRRSTGRGADGLGLAFQAGRDLVYWGNGLTLAQVLDGVLMTAQWGAWEVTAVAGITPVRTVDFDSSRPDFDHHTRRGFYGGMLLLDLGPHRPYVYAVAQQDCNEHDVENVGGIPTRFEYDSFYLGAGSAGSLSDRIFYGAELVLELGRGLSSSVGADSGPASAVAQEHEQILAGAADLRLEYLPGDPHRLRYSAELILASGDPDRRHTSNTLGGNRAGSRDNAFNAFGLVNTGLAFAPAASNLVALRLGASGFPVAKGEPWERLQVGVDVFVFGKMTADAPIDEPTTDGRYLGFEPDFFANWQVTNDVTVAVRYGVFFPGSAIPGDDSARHFFFVGVTYAL